MTSLILGGAASGKSEYAERMAEAACEQAGGRLYYIATMAASDGESRERIRKHRDRRADKGYETVECPTSDELSAFAKTLAERAPEPVTVLLDDLGNLVANELFTNLPDGRAFTLLSPEERAEVVRSLADPLRELAGTAGTLVLVGNDVFGDSVPFEKREAGTENYLHVLADLDRTLAAFADRVTEVTAGLPDDWKGGALS